MLSKLVPHMQGVEQDQGHIIKKFPLNGFSSSNGKIQIVEKLEDQ